jgi:enoyl-[acyl-carrier protein] reductase I
VGLLADKVGLVFGVANKRSIAWAIAQAASREGARLLIAYQNERLREDVEELAATLPDAQTFQCDLLRPDDIEALYGRAHEAFGRIDFLAHCVAFARAEDLSGRYLDTSLEGFRTAMEASVYTFLAAVRGAEAFLRPNSSIVTLTYLGSERAVPNYNVMGVAKAALEASVRYLANELGPRQIRVNALSAGPIRTLAARSIPGFVKMYEYVRERSPLRRNTEAAEVGDAAVFLFSDLARGITGETIYVDAGYHITAF